MALHNPLSQILCLYWSVFIIQFWNLSEQMSPMDNFWRVLLTLLLHPNQNSVQCLLTIYFYFTTCVLVLFTLLNKEPAFLNFIVDIYMSNFTSRWCCKQSTPGDVQKDNELWHLLHRIWSLHMVVLYLRLSPHVHVPDVADKMNDLVS